MEPAQARWECVGDPSTWDAPRAWFACPNEGSVSLLPLVPEGMIVDENSLHGGEQPVMLHVTVCPKHVRAVRRFLRAQTPEDIITVGTEILYARWDQIIGGIDVPVWKMTDLRSSA